MRAFVAAGLAGIAVLTGAFGVAAPAQARTDVYVSFGTVGYGDRYYDRGYYRDRDYRGYSGRYWSRYRDRDYRRWQRDHRRGWRDARRSYRYRGHERCWNEWRYNRYGGRVPVRICR